ncbi:hypothetical protein GIB67_007608, partial [Kingdonia uniflora]
MEEVMGLRLKRYIKRAKVMDENSDEARKMSEITSSIPFLPRIVIVRNNCENSRYSFILEKFQKWDESLVGRIKGCVVDSALVAAPDPRVISYYFPLSQCIEGLKVLVQSLFGATFHSISLAPGESWHEDVLKMSLHHPEEIVDLVCNFLAPSDSSTARLKHCEVETLLYEFGHAFHFFLSRTDYQHFSGTRVTLDLAELPSNLFEYYGYDYQFLRTFAKHYLTGEVIPEEVVESMKGVRNMFAATELQSQFPSVPVYALSMLCLLLYLKQTLISFMILRSWMLLFMLPFESIVVSSIAKRTGKYFVHH